ncbi:MAG: tRNA adenosine(34) deaminase TadA [Fibrobacter sp.]|nr:tRNA adenosine(34) deaminase TadA [Fibrobacter sp.]
MVDVNEETLEIARSLLAEEDERFMRMALREAEKAFEEKEIPIGCVIVKDGVVIGKGHNQIEMLKDATAHAEILTIGTASNALDNWRLDGCTLYVTLEPCPMCAGAILNSRISRVVYGSPDTRFGGCGTTIDVITDNALKRPVPVTGGILADECLGILKSFFQRMRLEKGDSGKKA